MVTAISGNSRGDKFPKSRVDNKLEATIQRDDLLFVWDLERRKAQTINLANSKMSRMRLTINVND